MLTNLQVDGQLSAQERQHRKTCWRGKELWQKAESVYVVRVVRVVDVMNDRQSQGLRSLHRIATSFQPHSQSRPTACGRTWADHFGLPSCH